MKRLVTPETFLTLELAMSYANSVIVVAISDETPTAVVAKGNWYQPFPGSSSCAGAINTSISLLLPLMPLRPWAAAHRKPETRVFRGDISQRATSQSLKQGREGQEINLQQQIVNGQLNNNHSKSQDGCTYFYLSRIRHCSKLFTWIIRS